VAARRSAVSGQPVRFYWAGKNAITGCSSEGSPVMAGSMPLLDSTVRRKSTDHDLERQPLK
jgi:hypothetical protein